MAYELVGNYNDERFRVIRDAVAGMNADLNGCFTIKERTTESNYLAVDKRGGCWSAVGYKSWMNPGQELSLDDNCISSYYIGIVQHELLHAMGLYHEQSRSDRDEYVTINWQNIKDGKEHNFNKYDETFVSHYGQDYNYLSVMHYHGNSF